MIKLFCVFQKDELIGVFFNKKKAINHMIDCWSDGMENIHIQTMTMTLKEYEKWITKEEGEEVNK